MTHKIKNELTFLKPCYQEDLEAEYTRSVFRTGELSYFLGKLTSRDLGLSSVPKCIVDSGIYLWLADIMQSMTKVNEMHLQLPVTQFKNRANLNVQASDILVYTPTFHRAQSLLKFT